MNLIYDNNNQTGILVYESIYISIHLSIVDNCTNGIIMLQGRYHSISNTIATNSKLDKIMLYATNSTRIMDCNTINNTNFEIIGSSISTSLMNVSVGHNQQGGGIFIDSSTSTSLMIVSVEHNHAGEIWDGMEIDSSTSTSLETEAAVE